jgi:serine/threonine protein phosphatase PrpC
MTVTKCPECAAPIWPLHRFCERCGANLRWAGVPCVACGAVDIDDDGFCRQCGRGQPAGRDGGRDHVELTVELAGTVLAAAVSDRGRRRQRNEDAMACGHVRRGDGLAVVAVVCDGVASVQRGDEAAQAAASTASEALLSAVGTAPDLRQATGDAVRSAGEAVVALARARNGSTGPSDARGGAPSSTFVSAVVTCDQVVVGWVGDSRVYWLGEKSRRLTTDHALGGVLTRWLGADAGEVAAQVSAFQPDGSGMVLVCSDGLWNYLPDADNLAAVALPARDPFTAATELTQRALDAGGRDNITVVVVPFPPRRGGTGER